MSQTPADEDVPQRLHDILEGLGRLASTCIDDEILPQIVYLACLVDSMKHMASEDISRHTLSEIEAWLQITDTDPEDPENVISTLHTEGAYHFEKYMRFGSVDDLEQAVTSWQRVVSLTPDGHPDKPAHLNNLGSALQTRFDLNGSVADLKDAISSMRQAVSLIPDGHPDKPNILNNIGVALQRQFERHGSLANLEDAISSMRLAVSLTPDHHPDKPSHLSNLGDAIQARFHQGGSLADLEEAISSLQLAASLSPDGHPGKSNCLDNLGNALQTRFNRHGSLADLEAAISSKRLAVALTPDGHSNKPRLLSNLGNALQTRFKRHNSVVDLEDAISIMRLAVDLTPDGHVDKPSRLNNLGNALQTRFNRNGSLADLDDAISSLRLGVSLTPDGHSHKARRLNNLGITLQIRFSQHGSLADLEDTISNLRLAVVLTLDDHPQQPSHLSNLGNALHTRFTKGNGLLADLEDAISRLRLAVSLTPDDHPDKPSHLSNLGNILETRFERHGLLADLEEAISSKRLANSLTPDDHPDKPGRLNNLGTVLYIRFKQHGSLADLEDVISNLQLAVSLTPDGHPLASSSLHYNLGDAFNASFQRCGDQKHLQSAISAAKDSALLLAAPSTVRLKSAILWARSCVLMSTTSIPAFDCAINLLPRVAWLGLALDDQYALLTKVGQVSRDAVAAAISEGEITTALEWAEQGRSIVWQNLLSLRTPLDELADQHPKLSQQITRLQEISRRLDPPAEAQGFSYESQIAPSTDHRMKLADERDRLIDAVRSTPGHESFMKPKSLQILAPAARDGPIVFLNLGTTCDALVLLTDDLGNPRVMNIHLGRVTRRKAEELSQKFVQLLRSVGRSVGDGTSDFRKVGFYTGDADDEASFKDILHILWTDYVQPVVNGLAYPVADERPPRLWWCPTGLLSFLPLHAAGRYDTAETGHKLSDYVVSSYTPSITALLDRSPPTPSENPGILTIAISNTPGMPLPSTEREVESLHRLAINLPTVGLKNHEATKERVLKELARCNWAHLACHGLQVGGKPMSSGLLLGDGKLELSEIIKTRLPNAEFAFLSACETAVGDKGVPEESAHLAAGMLFAGFRGVVATMWSIKDDVAPQVAEDVYQLMLANEKADCAEAVYGLHNAVRNLQERGESFQNWVPFIHIGR